MKPEQSRPSACSINMDQPTLSASPLILVVDDEPTIRFLAGEYLKDDGFQVLEAGDANEALALISTVPLMRALSRYLSSQGIW